MKRFLKIVMIMLLCFHAMCITAQDRKERKEIKKIANKACDCTAEIGNNITKDEIIEEINKCITTQTITFQMDATMKEVDELIKIALASKIDTVAGNSNTINLYADKNFKEIQEYMMKNCKAVKDLMYSDNLESEFSMSTNPEALKWYDEGIKCDEKGKNDKALECYRKAVSIDPVFAFAWDNMGICYRKKNDYKEAIKCYQKSLEVDPYGTMPLQGMGVAYALLEDYDNAGKTYERIIKNNPNDPEGYYGAGRSFFKAQEYEKGVGYMFKAYVLYNEIKSPYLQDAQNNLSVFYQDLDKLGKLDIFKKAAKDNGIIID